MIERVGGTDPPTQNALQQASQKVFQELSFPSTVGRHSAMDSQMNRSNSACRCAVATTRRPAYLS